MFSLWFRVSERAQKNTVERYFEVSLKLALYRLQDDLKFIMYTITYWYQYIQKRIICQELVYAFF